MQCAYIQWLRQTSGKGPIEGKAGTTINSYYSDPYVATIALAKPAASSVQARSEKIGELPGSFVVSGTVPG
jgi:hypothetical protein